MEVEAAMAEDDDGLGRSSCQRCWTAKGLWGSYVWLTAYAMLSHLCLCLSLSLFLDFLSLFLFFSSFFFFNLNWFVGLKDNGFLNFVWVGLGSWSGQCWLGVLVRLGLGGLGRVGWALSFIYTFFFFFFFVGLGGLGPLLSSFLIDSILQWYDYDHPKLKLKKLIQSRKRMYFL